jgi:uncharacterized protein
MSRDFPGLVDLWRLVERRHGYSGTWPLKRCARLKTSLHSDEGDVAFEIDFGTDDLGVRFADISVNTKLTLLCQRSLEPFLFQVERKTRLGLIENEEDEASLPAGYEPYIVPAEPLELVDLIEDELILALPVVPLGPQGPLDASFGPVDADLDQAEQSGPFAVLAGLKTKILDTY